ncbi:transposase [Sorangium sp. So ce1128]
MMLLLQLSLFGGSFLRLADDGTPVSLDEERFRIGASSPWAAEVSGFNVHAGVTVRAGDREGLEKLCRYGARPPFRLERLALLPDGRIADRLRRPRDGAPLAPPSEASAPAAQSGPRTRLGTGVTKPVGARIDSASLLRRV